MLSCRRISSVRTFVVFVFLGETVSSYLYDEEFTGKLAKADQFPYAIRLYSTTKDSAVTYCTATIITASKLLTAGHCCSAKAERFVVSGDPDHTDFVSAYDKSKYFVYNVQRVILHPSFERSNIKLVHDLCLLILERSMKLNGRHAAIPVSYERLTSKKNCTALGWGSTSGYAIQHKLYYKSATGYRCNVQFGNSSKYWFVCLEPHAVCPGDSGGPLVCDNKLYGIASFFISHGDEPYPRCEEGVVDYYIEMASERDFVEKNSRHSLAEAKLSTFLYTCILILLLLSK